MPRRGVNVSFTAILRGNFFLPAAPQIHSLTDVGVWGAQFRQPLAATLAWLVGVAHSIEPATRLPVLYQYQRLLSLRAGVCALADSSS